MTARKKNSTYPRDRYNTKVACKFGKLAQPKFWPVPKPKPEEINYER